MAISSVEFKDLIDVELEAIASDEHGANESRVLRSIANPLIAVDGNIPNDQMQEFMHSALCQDIRWYESDDEDIASVRKGYASTDFALRYMHALLESDSRSISS